MRVLKVILLFFLATPGLAELSRSDLDKLSSEKIIEYARMGEAEAQYWLGIAIYMGAISNWQSYGDHLTWMEMAAEQGHELAMSHIAKTYYNSDDSKLVSKSIDNLKRLAAKNWPEAHYKLWWHYKDNPVLGKFHLEKAAEAKLGKALAKLGYFKFLGIEPFPKEKSVGLELMHQSLNGSKSRFYDASSKIFWKCNTITDLNKIYSGTTDFFGNGFENRLKQIEILKLGVVNQCPVPMFEYSVLLREQEPTNDSLALNLLLELNNLGEYFEGWVQIGIAELVIKEGDIDSAKKFVALALKLPNSISGSKDDIIFSTIKIGEFETPYGIGAQICHRKKVEIEQCKDFILGN